MLGTTGTRLRRIGLGLAAFVLAAAPGRGAEAPPVRASDLAAFLGLRAGPVLRDQDGRDLGPDRFGDAVVGVAFFSTEGSILGVERLLGLARLVAGLEPAARAHVRMVAVTVDPAQDTPEALRAFAAGLGLDTAAVTLATGREDAVARLLASIGWRRAPGPDPAPPSLFVFDRRGGFALRYGAAPLDRPRLARDLATLADLAGGAGQGAETVSARP